MTRRNGSSPRSVTIKCLTLFLVLLEISCCHGLSLGRNPRQGHVARLSRTSASRVPFGSLPKNSNANYKLGSYGVTTSIRQSRKRGNQKKKGSKLYGYLDKLDRESGLNYNDYWGRKRNTTDLVESMQTMAGPLHTLVSEEMWADIRRRSKCYKSDWTDAFKKKRQVLPAILFLYFACLSPAVSFGTIASEITGGSIGIVEFLLSSGMSGMAYSILCGQPMAFVAPTGLTLAFISGLYRFCSVKSLPFFPVYAWVGLWTSFFFILLGLRGASKLIRYCTRFTDEVFNALLSVNFIYEAISSLQRNFSTASDPMNLTMPFVSLGMALTTYFATLKVIAFQSSKFFSQKVRTNIKNFGPVTVFVIMSFLNQLAWFKKFGVPTLNIPAKFELSGGRSALIALNAVPLKVKLLCSFPAMLLTSLFFMDQNISVRVANNPDNKLKKGPAYNLDMVALGLITGALSLVGLPWMCGATVQSMNHIKALTETQYNTTTEEVEITDVTETRVTGFAIHAMITATLLILPVLKYVPIPVVSGVFLFLGRKLMSGNSFFQRVRDSIAEKSRLSRDHPIYTLGRKRMNWFTAIQVACLAGLWAFKQNASTAIFFPSVIGMLMIIRGLILPKVFSETELRALGDATPW